MQNKVYSIYEAKARFSKIIREVRERGASVTISYHGAPVAEIRPVEPSAASSLEDRLRELTAHGILAPAARDHTRVALKPLEYRPGALRRFLEDRD